MENRLRELMGQPGVWLYLSSSNGWFKNVEILDINSETTTFRYESESETDRKIWEKTTRLSNIAEIDIRLLVVPKTDQKLDILREQFSRLMRQSDLPEENM